MTFDHQELWQKSFQFALDIHKETEQFPGAERYGLAAQLKKSAMKLPVALARFYCSKQRDERIKALQWVISFVSEIEVYLRIAEALGYLGKETSVRPDGFMETSPLGEKNQFLTFIQKMMAWAEHTLMDLSGIHLPRGSELTI